jgi:alpha-beta hydrolase superfamily lysophospholipase
MIAILLLASCDFSNMKKEVVKLSTSDLITIVGDYNAPDDAKKAVLLLHMMPALRQSWAPLVSELNKEGFATLAIDLRGHGESVVTLSPSKGDIRLDYKTFTDAEHQASRLDVDAALNFLKQKGFAEENISLLGASIGANLAIDAMARYANIAHGVALSPGLDYRGLQTESTMKALGPTQKTWIISSEGDKYSADSSVTLQQFQKNTSIVSITAGAEHGTNMFAVEPKLIPNIAAFLNDLGGIDL